MKPLPLALAALTLSATLGAAHAQSDPAAYLERSQVVPTGKVIHAYRVPSTDANGKASYSDLEITLSVNDKGKFGGSASVVAVKSAPLWGDHYAAGTYVSPDGKATCTLSVAPLAFQGRQQANLACIWGTSQLSAAWATGPMDGHPFELDLRAAGIDQIPGYENYGWGKVGFTTGGVWWGCFNTGDVVSAAQAGNQLTLNGYDNGNKQLCGQTLTLQP